MKQKTFSEQQQEGAGTLKRNRFINYLYNECGYRQVDIARKFGHSRQWAHHIVHRSYSEKRGFWGRLWDILTHPY